MAGMFDMLSNSLSVDQIYCVNQKPVCVSLSVYFMFVLYKTLTGMVQDCNIVALRIELITSGL